MTFSRTAFLALAMLAAAGAAAANPNSSDIRLRLDANGDGAIDREEAGVHRHLALHFDRLDANRNGRLEIAEVPPRPADAAGAERPAMVRLDTDGDGRISRAEAAGSPLERMFGRFDLDRDGHVTRSEYESVMLARMKARDEAEARFRQADINSDGRLSPEELERARAKRLIGQPRPAGGGAAPGGSR